MMDIDRFAFPWAFALLPLALLAAWGMLRRRGTALRLPTAARAAAAGRTWRVRLRWLPAVLRAAALSLLIVAIARPQRILARSKTTVEGIALQLVLDRSGSMAEPMVFEGREVTRIEAVKTLLQRFIAGDGKDLPGREGDLIGFISFARYADTICPLVHAYDALLTLIGQTQCVTVRAEDGTAIGDALALAAARLKSAEDDLKRRAAKADAPPDFVLRSKAILLVTDGDNNAGSIEPLAAAEAAAKWGIRLYAIGIGGPRYMVMQTPFGEQRIPVGGRGDDETMRRAAEVTGGRYWTAEDAESLAQVCAEIDEMEKTRVLREESVRREELFPPIAAAAGLAVLAEILLATLVFRRVP